MSVITIEALVENGQIRLPENLHLPEKTKVYVIVPDVDIERVPRIVSPRLADRSQARDFVLEISEEVPDAGI